MRIDKLISEGDLTERLRAFKLGTGADCAVFELDIEAGSFGTDSALAGDIGLTPDLLGLLGDLQNGKDNQSVCGEGGWLTLAFPIWLRSDGREYLKGCFASCTQTANIKEVERVTALARLVADSFTDKVSLNFGSRIARSEYDALHRDLDLGNKLISLLESLGTGMMIVDRDMKVVWANSIMNKRPIAYEAGEYCYSKIPADKPCSPCATRTTFETGEPQIGIPGRRPDGTIYTRTSTMPIPSADGTVSHVLTLITDVTESGHVDAELVNYKRLVDTSDDFMMISDVRGTTLAVNRKIVDVLGYSEDELLSKHPIDIVSNTDSERFRAAERTSAQLGIAMDTVTLQTKDGILIRTQMVLAYDRDRNVYEIIFRDISERLRMEAELREHTKALQDQNRRVMEVAQERDRFFRSVSHELRTPLTSIIGFAELLLEDSDEPLSAHQRKLMQRVVGNSHKLLAMVSDLLDLSRVEAGRMELHMGSVGLEDFLHQIVTNLEPLARAKDLRLKIKENGELPVVQTDEQKLSQIVVNLVSNAIKFTEKGSVKVSAKSDGKSFSISVKDTGPGIPEDECEAIFTEFYQARGSKGSERGSGLGLAISQRMATLLGGKITVKSKPGHGSTFTVKLPVAAIGEEPA